MSTFPSSADGFVNQSWILDWTAVLSKLVGAYFGAPLAGGGTPDLIKVALLEIVNWNVTSTIAPVEANPTDALRTIALSSVGSYMDTSVQPNIFNVINTVDIEFQQRESVTPVVYASVSPWWYDSGSDIYVNQGVWGLLDEQVTINHLDTPVMLTGEIKIGLTSQAGAIYYNNTVMPILVSNARATIV